MADLGTDERKALEAISIPAAAAVKAGDTKELVSLCRAGRLYEIERWIAAGKPLDVPAKYGSKVWSQPMRNLARQYGVSDAYLGRVCRLLRVPLPGLDYWAKKSAGRTTKKRPPLPLLPVEKEQRN